MYQNRLINLVISVRDWKDTCIARGLLCAKKNASPKVRSWSLSYWVRFLFIITKKNSAKSLFLPPVKARALSLFHDLCALFHVSFFCDSIAELLGYLNQWQILHYFCKILLRVYRSYKTLAQLKYRSRNLFKEFVSENFWYYLNISKYIQVHTSCMHLLVCTNWIESFELSDLISYGIN